MKIGNITLKHGIFLAPMAGVSDTAYRRIARRFGAEYTFTEMVSAKAIHYGDKKTKILASVSDSERPCAVQIFGSDPDIMAEAAEYIENNFSPDAVDINMGCPVKKVVTAGDGSALMKNPSLAYEIIKCVKQSVSVPVTVKIRAGWDDSSRNAVEIARLAEKAGADALTVHGRTRSQMYEPPVDLDIIRDVKNSVDIPVIGNGGIFSAGDALNMMDYTKCDGIMVARGSYGNPFIFREITCALENLPYAPPSRAEILNVARRHIAMLIEDKPHCGILEARKHTAWYIKGFEGAAAFRGRINLAQSGDEIFSILDEIQAMQ